MQALATTQLYENFMEDEVEALSIIFEDKAQIWKDKLGNTHVHISRLEPTSWAEFAIDKSDADFGRGYMTVELVVPPRVESVSDIQIEIFAPWLTSDLNNALVKRCFEAAETGFDSLTTLTAVIDCAQSECNVSALITEYKQRQKGNAKAIESPAVQLHSEAETGGRLLRIDPNSTSHSFEHRVAIYHGSELIDRRSVFQGHLAPVTTMSEVVDVLQTLRSNNRYARATHNMVCYRLRREGAEGVQQDHDSDGESGAGSKMQWLMDTLRVENVLVVVSRWYGGIHLGPDRFKHINSLTRRVLEDCGYLQAK